MRLCIFIVINFFFQDLLSQNLVPNGSFEHYDRCPGDYTQLPAEFRVSNWFSANTGTPDHFNVCSFGEADVPHNWAGVADPYEGTGYVGIFLWMATKHYREYLEVKLNEELIKDTLYHIEFRYKLSSYSKYSIDRIGLHLSDTLVKVNHDKPFKIEPAFSIVQDTAITKETGLWEEGKTIYKAKGGEKFLLIGNFYDNRSTHYYKIQFRPTPQPMVAQSAYYYIDDVSIVPKYIRDQQVLARIVPEFDLEKTKLNTNYVLNNINFQFNSYRLIPPSFNELDKVADYLLKHPELRVQLFGHTDDRGNDGYNLKLSQARAKNVAEYLSSVGIVLSRIDYLGYGKTQPIIDEKTEAARTINRRVEIRFVAP